MEVPEGARTNAGGGGARAEGAEVGGAEAGEEEEEASGPRVHASQVPAILMDIRQVNGRAQGLKC